MADRFYDTSAFAKHYRAELGSAKVDAFLAETGSHHFISALGVVELHSVLVALVISHATNSVACLANHCRIC